MRVEIPELKRCCFCLPLRRGLIFWAYLKLTFALVVATVAVVQLARCPSCWNYLAICNIIILLISVAVLDIAFNIFFLVRAHQKNEVHMSIFYRYSTALLLAELMAFLAFVTFEIIYTVTQSRNYHAEYIFLQVFAESAVFVSGQLMLQGYFVLLVRSEMRKLKAATRFEFVNLASQLTATELTAA